MTKEDLLKLLPEKRKTDAHFSAGYRMYNDGFNEALALCREAIIGAFEKPQPQEQAHNKQVDNVSAEIEARIQGRIDAIRCHTIIEQNWRVYRGSASFQDVALQTIEEAQLKAKEQS